MLSVKQYETELRRPVRGGVVALIGLLGAGVCFVFFAVDLQLLSEIDINSLVLSFVLCGLGAGLGFMLLYRLFPRKPPMSLFGKAGVRVERQTSVETAVQAARDSGPTDQPQSRSQGLTATSTDHPQKVSRYKAPENSAVFVLVSLILMGAVVSPRVPLGWAFLGLALLAGGALAFTFSWLRRRGGGANRSNYAVPVAGGAVVSAAMIGLGMVMMRFSFLRIFLELVLGAGAVIAVALHRLHGRSRDTSVV